MRGFAKITVYTAMCISMVSLVLWAGLLTRQQGWLKKSTLYYTIDASLMEVTVSEGIVQKLLTGGVKLSPKREQFFKSLVRRQTDLQDFTEYMCGLLDLRVLGLQNVCNIWVMVQWSSWGLIFAVLVGSICLALATMALYWYSFVLARANVRKWYTFLYGAASMSYISGMVQYFVFTSHLHDMPPKSNESPQGPSCMFGVFICFLSLIPLTISAMIGATYEEKVNEALSTGKKELRDYQKDWERDETARLAHELKYGSMNSAQAQVPQQLSGSPPAVGVGYGEEAPVYGAAYGAVAGGYGVAAGGYGASPGGYDAYVGGYGEASGGSGAAPGGYGA